MNFTSSKLLDILYMISSQRSFVWNFSKLYMILKFNRLDHYMFVQKMLTFMKKRKTLSRSKQLMLKSLIILQLYWFDQIFWDCNFSRTNSDFFVCLKEHHFLQCSIIMLFVSLRKSLFICWICQTKKTCRIAWLRFINSLKCDFCMNYRMSRENWWFRNHVILLFVINLAESFRTQSMSFIILYSLDSKKIFLRHDEKTYKCLLIKVERQSFRNENMT